MRTPNHLRQAVHPSVAGSGIYHATDEGVIFETENSLKMDKGKLEFLYQFN